MRKSNRQSGAAIVEFALVFMLFLVLSMGLFEMARAMWIYTTLSHAARQGARFAMVRGADALNPPTTATNAEIEQVVRNNAIGLVATDVAVTAGWKSFPAETEIDWETAAAQRIGGTFVVVRATYPIRFITGNVFLGGSGGLNLGSVSNMTISY